MNFLLDVGISPQVAEALRRAGHQVAHAQDIGLGSATDGEILEQCRRRAAVAVTTDKDLAGIVCREKKSSPSVITLRLDNPSAQQQTDAVMGLLKGFIPPTSGCWLVTLYRDRYRFRRLRA